MTGAATAVLASLAAEPDRARHGLDLARRAGLSSGSLYPTLVRLQRAGLIEAHWSAGRRAYRLTGPPPAAAARRRRLRPVLRWLPAALAALVTAWAVLARPADVRLSDLAVYTGAVEGLTRGASLYDFISAGNAPFTYPRSPAWSSSRSPAPPPYRCNSPGRSPRSSPSPGWRCCWAGGGHPRMPWCWCCRRRSPRT